MSVAKAGLSMRSQESERREPSPPVRAFDRFASAEDFMSPVDGTSPAMRRG